MSKAIQFRNKSNEKIYPCPYFPVGSIYLSLNDTNPSTYFGGTWELIKDKFLVGAGNNYSVNSTGGSKTHSHKYGLQYGAYYGDVMLESNSDAGLLNYSSSNSISLTGEGSGVGSKSHNVNSGSSASTKSLSAAHYRMTAQSEYVSTLPPYIAVYIWRRVS